MQGKSEEQSRRHNETEHKTEGGDEEDEIKDVCRRKSLVSLQLVQSILESAGGCREHSRMHHY